jgi:kinesin family protein C1
LLQNLSSEKEIFLLEKRSLLEEIKVLKSENVELNNKIKSSHKGLEEYDPSSTVINCNDQAKEVIELLNKKLNQSESKRRTLHNQLQVIVYYLIMNNFNYYLYFLLFFVVQELRGNIRVYVRCRPFLSSDGDEVVNSTPSVKFHPDGNGLSMVSTARGSGQSFSFDQVFSLSSTQNEVYDGISDLIQSSLDGYRVCIFRLSYLIVNNNLFIL